MAMPNSRPQIGDVAFFAYVTPRKDVLAAAKKAGWDENGGVGPMEYAEPSDHEYGRKFSTLEAAVAFAQKWIKGDNDFWGMVEVRRERFKRDDYFPQIKEWSANHLWRVTETGVESDEPVRE